MVHYRPGVTADAVPLSVLAQASFQETFGDLYDPSDLAAFFKSRLSPAAFADQLANPDDAFLIASGEGEAFLGFAQICPMALPFDTSGRRALQIDRLYVLTACHGLGIGRRLLDWALDSCWSRGADEIYLSVYCDNHKAQAIYRKRGFERVGEYHFMVGTHADDEYIMRLARPEGR